MSSFSDKVKAILSGDPPKGKKAAAKDKALTPVKLGVDQLLDEGSGAKDRQLAQKALPVLSAMQRYAASPTYLRRLKISRVDNPEQIQGERLAALSRVKFGHMTSGNNNTPRNYGWADRGEEKGKGGFIAMSGESPLSKIAHEISHNTNRSVSLPVSEGARSTTASGISLSPVESWKLVNPAKMDPQIKAKAFQVYNDSAKGEFGAMLSDPTSKVGGYDEHGKDSAELKSDLDGLRYLLYQNGITKNYGDDLDEEQLKRATNLPAIQKDEIFQRMLRQYDIPSIIKINNEIAKQGGENSNLA